MAPPLAYNVSSILSDCRLGWWAVALTAYVVEVAVY